MNNKNYKTKTIFKIYQISEDGLLKSPKDPWDNNVFNYYGYDNMSEAEEAIQNSRISGDFLAIPVISKNYEI